MCLAQYVLLVHNSIFFYVFYDKMLTNPKEFQLQSPEVVKYEKIIAKRFIIKCILPSEASLDNQKMKQFSSHLSLQNFFFQMFLYITSYQSVNCSKYFWVFLKRIKILCQTVVELEFYIRGGSQTLTENFVCKPDLAWNNK